MLGPTAQHRLLQEFRAMQSDPIVNILASPFSAKNLSNWSVRLNGPPDTPYQGGTFFLTIKFPLTYPLTPPLVNFNTKIYHCNVNSRGRVCIGLLENWNIRTSVAQIMLEVYCVLMECNPSDPLVQEFADLYMTDRQLYDTHARNWTLKFAVKSVGD